jgi:hypothetical protein
VSFPIAVVETFTKGKQSVRALSGSELEITTNALPQTPEIVVLRYAN